MRYSLLLEYWRTELREEATEVQNLEVIQTHIVMQEQFEHCRSLRWKPPQTSGLGFS